MIKELPLIYVAITEDMVRQARMDESKIIAQKGGIWDADGEWTEQSDDCDFIGSLAQQAVSIQFRIWGFHPPETPFFNPDITHDPFDFFWREERLDVKGSPTSKDWPDVYPKSRFLRIDHKGEKDLGKTDRYIFVKIDLQDRLAIIAGVIGVKKFWNIAQDCSGMGIKTPSHYVLAKDLDSFRDFVFGV
jgi:hypothetical protein